MSTHVPKFTKGLTTAILVWLQHQPLDKAITAKVIEDEMPGRPAGKIEGALIRLCSGGLLVRVHPGMYVRPGGKIDLLASRRESDVARIIKPAATKPTILGPDAEETVKAVLELLVGDAALKVNHLPAIEAWRTATRTLINAITQE